MHWNTHIYIYLLYLFIYSFISLYLFTHLFIYLFLYFFYFLIYLFISICIIAHTQTYRANSKNKQKRADTQAYVKHYNTLVCLSRLAYLRLQAKLLLLVCQSSIYRPRGWLSEARMTLRADYFHRLSNRKCLSCASRAGSSSDKWPLSDKVRRFGWHVFVSVKWRRDLTFAGSRKREETQKTE